MARVQSTNNFNNLLYSVERKANAQIAEHYGARVPLGVNIFKGYSRTDEILTTDKAKVNDKMGDLKYELPFSHSRPYGGFDARFDPTILNAVRKNFVDVSGRLIAPEDLPPKQNKNTSQHPLILRNIIS